MISFNIVTFVEDNGKTRLQNLDFRILRSLKSHGVRVNIYINSDLTPSEYHDQQCLYLKMGAANVLQGKKSLGEARNDLLRITNTSHLINWDDDDDIDEEFFKFSRELELNIPVYLQRQLNGKYHPDVRGDIGGKPLHGKFLSNGYACILFPTDFFAKNRISFPVGVEKYEDNLFYYKLLTSYTGKYAFLWNPVYLQDKSNSCMSLKTEETELTEFINYLTFKDSYKPDISDVFYWTGSELITIDGHQVMRASQPSEDFGWMRKKSLIMRAGMLKMEVFMIRRYQGILQVALQNHKMFGSRLTTLGELASYTKPEILYQLSEGPIKKVFKAMYLEKMKFPELMESEVIIC